MFEMWFDEQHGILRLTIAGFWDDAIAMRFGAAVRERSADIVTRHPVFDVLSDARGFAVQTPEVTERFAALAEQGAARRTAIVVSSALATMQARRSMGSDRVRIFGDMAAAEQWLAGE